MKGGGEWQHEKDIWRKGAVAGYRRKYANEIFLKDRFTRG